MFGKKWGGGGTPGSSPEAIGLHVHVAFFNLFYVNTNNPMSNRTHFFFWGPGGGGGGESVVIKRCLTLSWPISLHSHKPPGPHCFEPFTCNVYRSFQPQNMHMCKQFWGRIPQLKCSLRIKLTFGSYDFSFKMKMNSKSKRFSYLGKLNTRERL